MTIAKELLTLGQLLDLARGEADEGAAERLAALRQFLTHLRNLAPKVRTPSDDADDLTAWAREKASAVIGARRAISRYTIEVGRDLDEQGEEGAERALRGRSHFELLMDLFRGTEAQEWLEGYFDAEFDHDLHEAAEQFYHEAPAWVPESHWWWHWPRSGPPSE